MTFGTKRDNKLQCKSEQVKSFATNAQPAYYKDTINDTGCQYSSSNADNTLPDRFVSCIMKMIKVTNSFSKPIKALIYRGLVQS